MSCPVTLVYSEGLGSLIPTKTSVFVTQFWGRLGVLDMMGCHVRRICWGSVGLLGSLARLRSMFRRTISMLTLAKVYSRFEKERE